MLADLHNAEELKAAAVKFIVDRSVEFVDQVENRNVRKCLFEVLI